MFERYSEAARVALFGARAEVMATRCEQIDPEHLLLGLLHAAGGVAARLLADASVTLDVVRGRIVATSPFPVPSRVEVPFGASTRRILELALSEADAMSSGEITTGHLLLGLLRDDKTPAFDILRTAGVRLNDVRTEIEAAARRGREARAEMPSAVLEDLLDREEG